MSKKSAVQQCIVYICKHTTHYVIRSQCVAVASAFLAFDNVIVFEPIELVLVDDEV